MLRSSYAPLQIYREIDAALQKIGVQPGRPASMDVWSAVTRWLG